MDRAHAFLSLLPLDTHDVVKSVCHLTCIQRVPVFPILSRDLRGRDRPPRPGLDRQDPRGAALYRGTSPIRKRPPPYDPPTTLGIGLR